MGHGNGVNVILVQTAYDFI